MAEAAEIVGVTKSNFTAHRQKFNGEGQCPPPTAQLASGPVWAGPDVNKLRRWSKEFAKVRVTRAPRTPSKPVVSAVPDVQPDKARAITRPPTKKVAAAAVAAAPKGKVFGKKAS